MLSPRLFLAIGTVAVALPIQASACDADGKTAFGTDCDMATLGRIARSDRAEIEFLRSRRAWDDMAPLPRPAATCAPNDALCHEAAAGLIAILEARHTIGGASQTGQRALICGDTPTLVTEYDTATYPAVMVHGADRQAALARYPAAEGGYSGLGGETLTGLDGDTPQLAWAEKLEPQSCTTATKPADLDAISLAAICARVEASFYDPALNGLDWPALCAESRRALAAGRALTPVANDLLSRLKTSHTAYYAADDPTLAILYSVFAGAPDITAAAKARGGAPLLQGAGFFVREAEGKAFVDQVLDGSPAQTAGILPGDEIIRDGGAGFRAVWPGEETPDEAVEVVIRRSPDSAPQTIQTTLIRGDGLRLLADATAASVRVIERDGARIGYLHGWTMISRDGLGGPLAALQDAWYGGAFDGVDAIVFDARGRVGGGGSDVMDFYFAPSQLPAASRSRLSRDWDASGMPLSQIPLVTIIDDHTRSGAELMAQVIKSRKLGPLVGGRTAGAVTGGRLFPLPDGGALYLAVAALRFDGINLEGTGVAPDIAVAPAPPYGAGADPQLDGAIAEAIRRAG